MRQTIPGINHKQVMGLASAPSQSPSRFALKKNFKKILKKSKWLFIFLADGLVKLISVYVARLLFVTRRGSFRFLEVSSFRFHLFLLRKMGRVW